MILNFDSDTPIYIQIAEEIENAILCGVYDDEAQVPSTTEISVNYKINPATALKGMSKLVDEGILLKKRGVGMFVQKGAKDLILEKHKEKFFEMYVMPLILEAKKLTVTKTEINEMIKRGYEQ